MILLGLMLCLPSTLGCHHPWRSSRWPHFNSLPGSLYCSPELESHAYVSDGLGSQACGSVFWNLGGGSQVPEECSACSSSSVWASPLRHGVGASWFCLNQRCGPILWNHFCSEPLALGTCGGSGSPDDLWITLEGILPLPWRTAPGYCWDGRSIIISLSN